MPIVKAMISRAIIEQTKVSGRITEISESERPGKIPCPGYRLFVKWDFVFCLVELLLSYCRRPIDDGGNGNGISCCGRQVRSGNEELPAVGGDGVSVLERIRSWSERSLEEFRRFAALKCRTGFHWHNHDFAIRREIVQFAAIALPERLASPFCSDGPPAHLLIRKSLDDNLVGTRLVGCVCDIFPVGRNLGLSIKKTVVEIEGRFLFRHGKKP